MVIKYIKIRLGLNRTENREWGLAGLRTEIIRNFGMWIYVRGGMKSCVLVPKSDHNIRNAKNSLIAH